MQAILTQPQTDEEVLAGSNIIFFVLALPWLSILMAPVFCLFYIIAMTTYIIDMILCFIPGVIVILALDLLRRRTLPTKAYFNTVATEILSPHYFHYLIAALLSISCLTLLVLTLSSLAMVSSMKLVNPWFDKILTKQLLLQPYASMLTIILLMGTFTFMLAKMLRNSELGLRYGIWKSTMSRGWPLAGLLMFLANIAVAIIYYTRIYSSEGTYKPDWTEYLG